MAEWTRLGDRAIRFARPPRSSARAIVHQVRAWPGVIDVVVTRNDVAAYFAGPAVPDVLRIDALACADDDPAPPRDLTLHAVYDGPDLEAIAAATQLAIADVIERHAAATYTVETMGFAPGFAYLSGLDPRLELPRRATPRPRLPAGSIAIAETYTAVYPFDSPGGWHLVGRIVGPPMFGPDGAVLQLGDRVRFAVGTDR